jgi:hypothetical protein
MPAKIAHIFPQDNQFGEDDGLWCDSGGEIISDSSDDNGMSVESLPCQVNDIY